MLKNDMCVSLESVELSPCRTCVQLRRGTQYRGGYHDACGGYHDACGGYLEYRGGCSVLLVYLEYCGGVQYRGGYHEYRGGFLSTVGDTQYLGGYHEAHGGIS